MIPVLLLALAIADAPDISGIVRDPTGAVVAGASVVVRPASGAEHVALTGSDGRFAVDMPGDGDVTVIVRAGGFAEKSQPVGNGERGHDLEIVLEPAMLLEAVTVTATKTEQRLGDVPASSTILSRDEIRHSNPSASCRRDAHRPARRLVQSAARGTSRDHPVCHQAATT